MATVTTVKKPGRDVPNIVAGITPINLTFSLAADLADNGDDIELFDLPEGAKVFVASSDLSATLGASCTAQLRCGTTALAAASTAGGADFDAMARKAYEVETSGGETVNLLIGGADMAAAATLTVTMLVEMP